VVNRSGEVERERGSVVVSHPLALVEALRFAAVQRTLSHSRMRKEIKLVSPIVERLGARGG